MIAVTLGTIDLHGSVQPLHGGIHNHRLSTIIFGSGMFNNNMSLIFVMTLERLIHGQSLLQGNAYIQNFMKVGVLSTVFGFGMGGILTYLMRKGRFLNANAIYEVFFVVLGAYATYMLAHLQFFQLSGDVAIFFYGFFVGHYNKFNMSLDGIRQIGLVLNVVYIAAEAFCFIYLGLSFESSLDSKYYNLIIAAAIIVIALGCRFFCLMLVAIVKR
jgi:NhaP-type Na+/H+ or K+/H+ antiporter